MTRMRVYPTTGFVRSPSLIDMEFDKRKRESKRRRKRKRKWKRKRGRKNDSVRVFALVAVFTSSCRCCSRSQACRMTDSLVGELQFVVELERTLSRMHAAGSLARVRGRRQRGLP